MGCQEYITRLEQLKLLPQYLDELGEVADKLNTLARDENNLYATACAEFFLAHYEYFKNNDLDKTISHAKISEKLCSDNSFEEYLFYSCNLLGNTYIKKSMQYEALSYFLKVQKLAKKNKNVEILATTYLNIGNIYDSLNNNQQALDYYEKAKFEWSSNRLGYTLAYRVMLYNIISKCLVINKVGSAKKYLSEAMVILDRNDGNVYDCLKQTSNIKINYVEKKLNNIEMMINKLYELVETCPDATKAFECLFSIKDVVNNIDNKEMMIRHTEIMTKLSKKIDNVKYYLEAAQVKIEFSRKIQERVSELRALREFYSCIMKNGILNNKNFSNTLTEMAKLSEINESSKKKSEETKKLIELSSIDDLTKLFNRRAAQQEIEATLSDTSKTDFAFLIIDVDYFKEFNDMYGHRSGDEVLMILSDLYRTVFEENAICGRLGGDEFIIFLYNLPHDFNERKDAVIMKVEEFRETLKLVKLEELDNKSITVSIGISLEDESYDELYSNADVALYEAKYGGKDSYSFYPD